MAKQAAARIDSDPLQGWGTVIGILVAVHILAFVFWVLQLSRAERAASAAKKKD